MNVLRILESVQLQVLALTLWEVSNVYVREDINWILQVFIIHLILTYLLKNNLIKIFDI